MTDRQESKLNMYSKVSDACRSYENVYLHVSPIMKVIIGQLDDIIVAINQTAQQQAGTITQGFTVEKNITINLLAEHCMKIVNVLYVYAFRNNDRQLLSKMSINKYMLYSKHDNEILRMAKNIALELENLLPMLSEYGLDPHADLTMLNKIIAGFESLINKPQITVSERKIHTTNLKQLFVEADSLLYDQLDKLVSLFKASAPDFYNLYKTARNVIHTGKRSSSKKGTGTDAKETETK